MSQNLKNKVLIICYSFPPHPGIGGRRWAKFSKLLSKKGYEVFVVGANNLSGENSFWTKDVEKSKMKIKAFDFQYQKIIKHPSSILDRIIRKIILTVLNTTKYNPSVITSLPNKNIWNSVKELIVKENIKKVIVSGDPYLFYYASTLKQEIEFDLVLDYRDLWNDHTFYGDKVKLSARQKEYFESAENYAVNNCNKIIFVDEYLESVVKKRISSKAVSTCVINNGFDKEDFDEKIVAKTENGVMRIFFAGSISSDLNPSVLAFVSAFKRLSVSDPNLFKKFSISIFGEIDSVLVHEIENLKLSNLLIENKTLKITEYYRQLKEADVGLVILSEEYKNSFVTKFADYLFYDKYIVALGFKGYFTNYIEKQNVGLGFDSRESNNFFETLVRLYKTKNSISNEEKEKFDLDILTQKLIENVIDN